MLREVVAAVIIVGGLVAGLAPAVASAGPPYETCADAARDGKSDMTRDDPGYADWLDRDRDGIACES